MLIALLAVAFPWIVLGALFLLGSLFQAFWNYDLVTILFFMGSSALGLIILCYVLAKREVKP